MMNFLAKRPLRVFPQGELYFMELNVKSPIFIELELPRIIKYLENAGYICKTDVTDFRTTFSRHKL